MRIGVDMYDDERQCRRASKPPIDWHSLVSWVVIIVGFSLATFLLLP
jgi:hypothetical protein